MSLKPISSQCFGPFFNTDAPDILGLDTQAGPFLSCTRIGQQISESERMIANVIEYGPRAWAASRIGQLSGDRLQQRVLTTFARREGAPACVDLKTKGAAFVPKQAFGVSLEALPPLKLVGGLEPPFGSFEVLYCEAPPDAPELVDDVAKPLRIIRTAQGYTSINRRVGAIGEQWGEL